jgi:hypothetical protein
MLVVAVRTAVNEPSSSRSIPTTRLSLADWVGEDLNLAPADGRRWAVSMTRTGQVS